MTTDKGLEAEVSWGENRPHENLDMGSCKDEGMSYRRLRLLGQGSFGKAFLARDLANNELCVMKQIRVEKMDAKARDTAVREAVALRRILHPNVVRFRQVFVRSGWLCLVMDFADGGDLCAAVKERAKAKMPFEESAVLECFAQISDAVNWVHSMKMVHRDIKSRNIFLCRTGRALLGDFGLVRLLETTCELAQTRVGTPYYLSPEIIRKQPYSYKTDVWSLGVLLYEIAALSRPFVGTLETLPRAIIKGQYEPIGRHYSQGLHDLVAGMLQVDPAYRLDLGAALSSEVLSAPLFRAREALGLEEPRLPEERRKRPEKRVEEIRPEPVSEWIGYNTMVRRAGDPILQLQPGQTPEDILGTATRKVVCLDLATAAETARENWSLRPERDADSGDEAPELCESSDSWGSVVDGGVEALTVAQASVEVEQQWVGWLLGSRGAVMREIEQSSGAKISIDQSTKELGYSTVCITGSHHSIATARHMVLDKLAQVDPSASQHAAPVKQPARKDEAIGALVETLGLSKDLELSKVRELAQAVLEVIPENVDDAKGGGFNGGMARPSVGNHVDLTSRGRAPLQAPSRVSSPAFSREEALELQVEQKWVGWILGKGGSTMRDIEAETGAKVSIDQSTKELGYSVVKMSGSSMAVQKAQQRIQASLSHVTGKAPAAEGQAPIGVLGAAEEEMQVEQRLIGWVLGARGVVLKEIETSSGARISIDQSTKELGFSTLRISGSYDSISAARVLVSEKMLQAG